MWPPLWLSGCACIWVTSLCAHTALMRQPQLYPGLCRAAGKLHQRFSQLEQERRKQGRRAEAQQAQRHSREALLYKKRGSGGGTSKVRCWRRLVSAR